MYPLISLWDIKIYVFGIFLLIAWIVFFSLLLTLSQKKGIVKPIFNDIFSFTISMFFFGRLFDMFSKWRDSKFLFQGFFTGQTGIFDFFHAFFINDNYNLSLAGGIIGFAIVFFYKSYQKKHKWQKLKYLDIIMPSFLVAALIGYFGALLGGQVYGVASTAFFAINYNTKNSMIPGVLFPLPIFYMIGIAIILFASYKISRKTQTPDGYIGFIMMWAFGLLLFLGEFLSGSPDMFEVVMRINQIVGLTFLVVSIIWIVKFLRS